MNEITVIDIDPNCPKFMKREIVQSRRVIFDHNKKKSRQRIINILKKHEIVLDFSILKDITLVNILTDCCYANNARKLLGDEIQ